jgi:hypothetical protein
MSLSTVLHPDSDASDTWLSTAFYVLCSHDEKPWYFIFGGLVFTRLTAFYLRSAYGADWTTRVGGHLADGSSAQLPA